MPILNNYRINISDILVYIIFETRNAKVVDALSLTQYNNKISHKSCYAIPIIHFRFQ
jgi:hypothetical protein